VTGVAFYSWTSSQMAADVQAWLDGTAPDFGWVVIGNETTADSAKRFDSREHSTPANRPKLTIVYSPVVVPTVSFTAEAQTVSETAGTATISAQLSSPAAQPVTVPFTVGGSATGGGVDYTIEASSITIPAGDTSAEISVGLTADLVSEAGETVVLSMGSPANATLGSPAVHTLTIADAQTTGPRITAPTRETALPETTVTFEWTAGGEEVAQWTLLLGSSRGASDLHTSGALSGTSTTVSGLPADGNPVYARLGYTIAGSASQKDFLYAACCPELLFTKQPVRGAHGFAFGIQPEVAVRAGGSTVAIDNSTMVTLSLDANPNAPDAVLTCTGGLQQRVVSGVAAFAGCSIDTHADGYVLRAAASPASPVAGTAFQVRWAGDADGTCSVNIVDFSILLTTFGKASGAGGFDSRGDFDGDDKADIVDFSILLARFGAVGTGCSG